MAHHAPIFYHEGRIDLKAFLVRWTTTSRFTTSDGHQTHKSDGEGIVVAVSMAAAVAHVECEQAGPNNNDVVIHECKHLGEVIY